MGKQLSLSDRNDFEALSSKIAEFSADAEKFYHKNNTAAGTRLSVGLRAIELQARAARKNVQVLKKARNTKPKV